MKTIFILTALMFLSLNAHAQQLSPEATQGKAKFDVYCATCHGPTGMGDGPASLALNPKPRNFRDPTFQKTKTDAALAKVIKEGGAANGLSPVMPAWGASLSDVDIQNVIAYIRQLGKSAK